jgi:glycosyltransferase involved in cell wall biosynthesis
MNKLKSELPSPGKRTGWPWVGELNQPMEGKKSWPKISIVTPSYNQGKFIEETIRSVILQNYPNLEYIIIDGGSTDETLEIIKKYEPWISYWESKPDKGQTHAINKGFQRCTGEIFNWLNSDDYLEPNILFFLASKFQDEETDVVSGRERRIDVESKVLNYGNGTLVFPDLADTIGRCYIQQPSTFFRRNKLMNVFPLNDSLHFHMDGEMWVRFLLSIGQGGIVETDEVIVNFRLHHNSKSIASKNKFLIDDNTFENSLLDYLDVKNYASQILRKRESLSEYRANWVVNKNLNVDIGKMMSWFANHSLQNLYLSQKFEEAIVLAEFIRRNNYFLFKRDNIGRFRKKVYLTQRFKFVKKVVEIKNWVQGKIGG